MKILVIKKASKKNTPSRCAFFVEALLESRK